MLDECRVSVHEIIHQRSKYQSEVKGRSGIIESNKEQIRRSQEVIQKHQATIRKFEEMNTKVEKQLSNYENEVQRMGEELDKLEEKEKRLIRVKERGVEIEKAAKRELKETMSQALGDVEMSLEKRRKKEGQ